VKKALIDPGHRCTQDSHYLVLIEASTLVYIKMIKIIKMLTEKHNLVSS